jgi:hypothetical protein
VGRTELLETGDDPLGKFAALRSLLLNLIEKAIQFCVDLK